ncbi:TonB-dependent receptor [Phenylobacterium sp.]|uniref:TonB-dependent receptor n=1 Tax=Phenylobacterium sp. TaxID=1871053 RepID=UPI003BAB077C
MTAKSFHHRYLRHGLIMPSLAAALAANPAAAICAPAPPTTAVAFNIEAGTLDAALMAYAVQTGRQLIYPAELVAGRRSLGLKERLSPDEALDRLLAGTGIAVQRSRPNVIVLKLRATPVALGGGSGASETANSTVTGSDPSALVEEKPGQAPAEASTTLSEVVVTGTLIRGPTASPSPVVTVSREQLDQTGRATVADLLSELPQNFGGVGSPDTFLTGSDRLGTNAVASTGVNLRGLGTSATLVLVDGRRMAGTGLKGDFADVSAIPTAAVERVEVLLDGASALYGSDAVGGVVNIILRRNFDGAETRARLGVASGGAAQERQFGPTFGKTWASGHALLSYEYYHRDALAGAERDFTANADLRPLGGTDRRLFYSHPGNVMRRDAATSAYVPTWAIPPGQNGAGLTPASFLAGQVNLENQRAQADILPKQERNSVYLNVGQALSERIDLMADARYSRREFAYALPGSVALITVNRNNPFFVSPNGATSNQIAYSFTDELGPLRSTGSSESLGTSAGLTADVGKTWRAEAYGAFAEETGKRSSTHRLNTRFLQEALGTIADDPATSFSAARDGYFNAYGEGAANSRTVLDFVGSGYVASRNHSQVASANAKADGVVLTLPGGDMKAAVGVQVRRERFETSSVGLTSKSSPLTQTSGPYERTVSAAFLELRVPIVGPDNAVPGIERLEASIAGRIEHYDDVGTTRNPKVGLIWSPAAGVTVRTSYGTSFRAPALSEVYEVQDAGPGFLPQGGAQKLVLLQVGGNLDLEPESARSWTAGVEIAPKSIPGLRLSAGGFDIKFTDQIAQPVSDDIYNVLSNPIYAPFVHAVDPNNPADLARVTALLAQSTSSSAGLFPANAYTAIVDARFVNTGGFHVRGLDLAASYGFDVGADRFDLAANATYLIDYKRQVTPDGSWTQFVDVAGQPVDLRAQGSVSWTRGPFGATLGVNYVDDYHDSVGHRVGSWTTADLQLRWRPTAGPARGLLLALSVQNLFDRAPPFYDAPQGVGYDPANADPIGRFASLQLTKRW